MRDAAEASYTFCGHVHDQALFFEAPNGRMTKFHPVAGRPIPVRGHRRWVAIVGSVGQPRDRNPAAAYTLFDSQSAPNHVLPRHLRCRRGRAKIRGAGLPGSLAAASKRASRAGSEQTAHPDAGRGSAGAVVDGYRVAECIHNGGTGAIFRVDPPDGADPAFPLVMKVPRIGRGESTLGIESFEVEQMILPGLRGPHVPRVVPPATWRRTPYIVMERIEGLSLAKIVASAAPPEEVARIGAALADAIQSVHAQDVVHLDLKPENVMLRPPGEALLLDFGFSRHAHYPDLLGEEQHFAAGSAAYVSRSSCRTIAAIRAAISMRSACCSTSSRPASRRSAKPRRSPACATGCGASRCRRECCAGRPPWLQEVILHCLENDPAVRYQSAAHVALDLRNPDQVVLSARASAPRRPASLAARAVVARPAQRRSPLARRAARAAARRR
jgi:hypothetical protein